MSWAGLVVLFVGALVAFVNGTNDVSKGVATLVGSGLSDYRPAIRWGTFWTAAGGLTGTLVAGAMVTTFGRGLLAADVVPTFAAALASILGAAAWVLVATGTGLPVSTTHAIVGSVVGVSSLAYGPGSVRWDALAATVVLPLLLAPLLSLGLTVMLLRVFRSHRPAPGERDCVCAEVMPATVALRSAPGAMSVGLPVPGQVRLMTGSSSECAEHPAAVRLTLDHLHWLTSGATSFARGMNDAPKMVALVLAASALSGGEPLERTVAFVVVTLGMVLGSLAGGRRVTRVLARKVTPMNPREGFIANLVTSVLVASGAVGGLPMSTTHVASGGIIGAGAQRESKTLDLSMVRDMLLAWVATVPSAALLGLAAYGIAQALYG